MKTKISSKIENVYQQMLTRISTGAWPVGECLPTEFELASEYHCGRQTVSQAITRLVHEGLVLRRRRAGTRVVRATLRSNTPSVELDAFAFIYPSDRHEGIWRTVNGFQDAARKASRRVVTLTIGTDYEREIEFVSRLAEFDVKAAAIYPMIPSPDIQMQLSHLLVESKFPIVLADLNLPGLGRPSVVVDNFHAGYAMTRHLLGTGISRIGFLANQAWAPSVSERYRGFLWAMEEAGKTVVPEGVLLETEMRPNFDDPLRDPTELAHRYLEKNPKVEGVVCAHDILAHGLIRAARAHGFRVPEEIKVTGVDDFATQFQGEMKLTTYHVPFEELGRQVFETLDALLSNKPMPGLETRVRGEVVVRETA
ncbi:MAG: GntR family transcriptional regulator [Opitutaceae bacterium]|jgi:DNA-binding LacI/PurR family transcriptional regulator